MVASRDQIREIDGIWLPIRARMTHLLDESYTRLRMTRLSPNPELPKKFFTQGQLESSRLRLPEAVREACRELE